MMPMASSSLLPVPSPNWLNPPQPSPATLTLSPVRPSVVYSMPQPSIADDSRGHLHLLEISRRIRAPVAVSRSGEGSRNRGVSSSSQATILDKCGGSSVDAGCGGATLWLVNRAGSRYHRAACEL